MKKINVQQLFSNDRFVKFLSVVLAIFAWVMVIIVVDPEASVVIKDVPVVIDTTDTAAGNLGLEVIEGGDLTVDVALEGKLYVVGALRADDLVVTVPLANVIEPGAYQLKVQAKTVRDSDEYRIRSTTPATIEVSFDRIKTQTYPLQVQIGQVKVEQQYIMEKPYASVNEVVLKGPEQEIEQIARVVAYSDLSDTIGATVVQQAQLQYYDADNNLLTLPHVICQPDKIDITIPVYKEITLPLKIQFANIPTNFPIDRMKYQLSTASIPVGAPNDAVDKIGELDLGYIDFRYFEVGKTYTFPVTMPSGFINISNINEVTATFSWNAYSTKRIRTTESKVVNPPSNYTIATKDDEWYVHLAGLSTDLDSVQAQDVVVEIDLASVAVKEGTQRVPAKVYLMSNKLVWALGEYDATITATAK